MMGTIPKTVALLVPIIPVDSPIRSPINPIVGKTPIMAKLNIMFPEEGTVARWWEPTFELTTSEKIGYIVSIATVRLRYITPAKHLEGRSPRRGTRAKESTKCWDEETPDNDGPETTKPRLKAVRITGWDDGKKVSQGARDADEPDRNTVFLQERLAQKADRRSKCAHKRPEEKKVA